MQWSAVDQTLSLKILIALYIKAFRMLQRQQKIKHFCILRFKFQMAREHKKNSALF